MKTRTSCFWFYFYHSQSLTLSTSKQDSVTCLPSEGKYRSDNESNSLLPTRELALSMEIGRRSYFTFKLQGSSFTQVFLLLLLSKVTVFNICITNTVLGSWHTILFNAQNKSIRSVSLFLLCRWICWGDQVLFTVKAHELNFKVIIIESKNIKYLKRSDKSTNPASYVIQNFFLQEPYKCLLAFVWIYLMVESGELEILDLMSEAWIPIPSLLSAN